MHREFGMTLIEVLLVLAIAMSILVMSLRQYYSYRLDADMMQLSFNVNTLFEAAAAYYQANCGPGKQLDPNVTTATRKPLNITTDLINAGYLASNFPIPNPLVDGTAPGSGYVVQFNEYTMPRMQPVCSDPPDCTTSTPIQVGTIIIWKIQVAVATNNMTAVRLANTQAFLQADCVSTVSGSPPMSALCSTNPTTGTYLVFERLPSFVNSDLRARSPDWLSMPLLKQFNQMYTTNPITDLTNQSHTPEYQYYYCNG